MHKHYVIPYCVYAYAYSIYIWTYVYICSMGNDNATIIKPLIPDIPDITVSTDP